MWQLAREALSSFGEFFGSLSWVGKIEWCVAVLIGLIVFPIIFARLLRNLRFPRQFGALARMLGARRPSWWASHHRPSLEGCFRGVKVYLDFLDRAQNETQREVGAPVWVVLRVQAPIDLAGAVRPDEQYEVLERLGLTFPEQAQTIWEAGRDLWHDLGPSDELAYAHGWARMQVASHWDASELTPARLMRLVAGAVTLLGYLALAQRDALVGAEGEGAVRAVA